MPYFHNDNINLLFIHIPKTGGTSLEEYFSTKFNIQLTYESLCNHDLTETTEYCKNNQLDIHSSLQHMTYSTIMKYKDFFKINTNNLKIITTVRNPYERIISDLFFFKKINVSSSKEEVFQIIQQYLTEHLDNHNIPQHLFVTDENKQLIPTIEILRMETLTNDMSRLGYADFNIFSNKNSNNINYYDYLNNSSIHLINNYYDYDFELFHYNEINN
jgi:hypothetical protein